MGLILAWTRCVGIHVDLFIKVNVAFPNTTVVVKLRFVPETVSRNEHGLRLFVHLFD